MRSEDNLVIRWDDYAANLNLSFRSLRRDEEFCDVVLCCDNGVDRVCAHRVVLAACSTFFKRVLGGMAQDERKSGRGGGTPTLYLKGVHKNELTAILNFMYHGEVRVAQDSLNIFLSVAEELQVKGLIETPNEDSLPTEDVETAADPPHRFSGKSHRDDFGISDKEVGKGAAAAACDPEDRTAAEEGFASLPAEETDPSSSSVRIVKSETVVVVEELTMAKTSAAAVAAAKVGTRRQVRDPKKPSKGALPETTETGRGGRKRRLKAEDEDYSLDEISDQGDQEDDAGDEEDADQSGDQQVEDEYSLDSVYRAEPRGSTSGSKSPVPSSPTGPSRKSAKMTPELLTERYRKYENSRKYRPEWEDAFTWLTKAKGNMEYAYCKVCDRKLRPKKASIFTHSTTSHHVALMRARSGADGPLVQGSGGRAESTRRTSAAAAAAGAASAAAAADEGVVDARTLDEEFDVQHEVVSVTIGS